MVCRGANVLPEHLKGVCGNSAGKLLENPSGCHYQYRYLIPLLGASHWSSILVWDCAFDLNLVTIPTQSAFVYIPELSHHMNWVPLR